MCGRATPHAACTRGECAHAPLLCEAVRWLCAGWCLPLPARPACRLAAAAARYEARRRAAQRHEALRCFERVRLLENGASPLALAVRRTHALLDGLLRTTPVSELAVCFHGGKDATVLLYMVRAVLADVHRHSQPAVAVPVAHFGADDDFPERRAFACDYVESIGAERVAELDEPPLRALWRCVSRGRRTLLLGTRAVDRGVVATPSLFASSAAAACRCVAPLEHWTYHDIWTFVFRTHLPLCELYGRGHTSLGWAHAAARNAVLRGDQERFAPAWRLERAAEEHRGRGDEKRAASTAAPSVASARVHLARSELVRAAVARAELVGTALLVQPPEQEGREHTGQHGRDDQRDPVEVRALPLGHSTTGVCPLP